MTIDAIRNIVLIDKENKNYLFLNDAAKLATRTQPSSPIEATHVKNIQQLIASSADLVFISTSWILENDMKWFYHYFENNFKIKFVILINHDSQIKKLLNILNTLPLESQVCFIPIDNYSRPTIVQSMENYIITND